MRKTKQQKLDEAVARQAAYNELSLAQKLHRAQQRGGTKEARRIEGEIAELSRQRAEARRTRATGLI